jgi:Tfp pilus assembly protein PilF
MGHGAGEPLDSAAGPPPGPPITRRRAPARLVVVGGLLLVLAGGAFWAVNHWRRPAPATEGPAAAPAEDPRLSYAGPFLNVHPDVAYVGDDSCADCHQKETLSYRQHPMGRSLVPIARVAARQRYDAGAHNPFEALGVQFLVQRQGDGVVHRQVGRDEKGEPVYESDTPVHYALGSGERGYSYLTDHDGFVFQSPVSWYSDKQIWDASPGFSAKLRAGRPVMGSCLFCHANRVRPREGYVNRYEEPLFDGHAIGCERCHGPGERHVKDPGHTDRATGADYTIVNPRHLAPELRAAVCEQCHLVGEAGVVRRGRDLFDFRPGMPLSAFWSLFVRQAETDAERKAVGHVEQMYQSRCFLRSEERPAEGKRKLGCTSCHDPHQHVGPAERVAHYRARCLECHGPLTPDPSPPRGEGSKTTPPSPPGGEGSGVRGCSVPEATRRLRNPQDSCIDCHMPRYPAADIAHTASTDHRILRRPAPDAPAAAGRAGGEAGVVPFYRPGLDDKDAGRDLGIALAHVMVQGLAGRRALAPGVGARAVDLLEAAVRDDPSDLEARERLAEALSLANRPADALAAYEAVLAGAPDREASLMGAAMLAQSLQKGESALAYWRRAVAVNPWHATYRASLARLLAEQKAWDEARPHCEAWVRLDPASIDARVLWVSCLARTGDKAAAGAEFDKIRRLHPPDLPVLEARFAVELRSR